MRITCAVETFMSHFEKRQSAVRKKCSTPEYDKKQNLTTWHWTGPTSGGLASPGWTAITRNMATEPATDMLVSNTHAKIYKQTIFQPIKTMKKKHLTPEKDQDKEDMIKYLGDLETLKL